MLLLLTFSLKCFNADKLEAVDDIIGADSANALVETAPISDASYNYNNYIDPAYAQEYYQNYDPKYQLGYDDQYSQDELQEKQGVTPADFIPFVASLTLPLASALATFVAIIAVSAAFLLFPETIEIDVNSRKRRFVDDDQDRMNFLSFPSGFCGKSSSKLCYLLEKILASIDCVEAARCEVAHLSESSEYPVMSGLIKPFVPQSIADRFRAVDCSSIRCPAGETVRKYFNKNKFTRKNYY